MIDPTDKLTINIAMKNKPPIDDFIIDLSNPVTPSTSGLDMAHAKRPFTPVTQADISEVANLREATFSKMVMPENPNPRLAGISENMLSLAVDLGVDASLSAKDMIKEAAHDMAHAKRPFTPVKELDTAKQELATTDEIQKTAMTVFSESETDLAIELGVNLAQDALELVQDAALSIGKAATLLVKAGLELIAAKSLCQHGEFKTWCEKVGIQHNRATEAMSYARFASQLDPKERGKYLLLPKRSAVLLANAEPALVEFLLEDGNEELARKLRKRSELVELARELTETEDALGKTAKENEALHKELKALKEAQYATVAGSEYPASVIQLRKEAAVLADEAIASLSSIRYHASNFDYLGITGCADQDERNMHAAMFPCLNNIASIISTATKLMNDLCDSYGINPADIAGRTHAPLNESELAVIEAARDVMLARKKGKAAARQGDYSKNGDLTRDRGRPRKGE